MARLVHPAPPKTHAREPSVRRSKQRRTEIPSGSAAQLWAARAFIRVWRWRRILCEGVMTSPRHSMLQDMATGGDGLAGTHFRPQAISQETTSLGARATQAAIIQPRLPAPTRSLSLQAIHQPQATQASPSRIGLLPRAADSTTGSDPTRNSASHANIPASTGRSVHNFTTAIRSTQRREWSDIHTRRLR